MSEMKPYRGICYKGVPKVIRARIVNASNINLTQASTTAITYIVDRYGSETEADEDADATSVQAETSAGSVSSLMYDTLQSWPEDDTGFNFAMTLPAASFPVGNQWYRVEVWVDPATGEDFLGGYWLLECRQTSRD